MSNKEKHSKIERAYRILEYLRRNSDQEHTITQASLRKNPEISPYVGDKETYNDTIVKLAEALNFDEYALNKEGIEVRGARQSVIYVLLHYCPM